MLTALLVAGDQACTSQRAIVIIGPKDAASEVEPDGPMPSTDSTPDLAADHAPDRSSDPAPESAPDLATEAAATGLLFGDDFADGYERYWQPPGDNDGTARNTLDGNNRLVTLDSTDHSFTRLRCNLDGSLFSITDITASMRFRVEQALSSSRVRLDVRQASATENVFFAVGAVVDTDGVITKVGIYKKVQTDEPNYTICALAETTLDPPVTFDQWHTMKLTVSGFSSVHLTAYLDEAPMAATVDDCVSPLTATNGDTVANGGCISGQTGLGIQVEGGLIASVDDVLVTAP